MNTPQNKPTILVVDDTPDNIDLLCAVLEDDYRTKIAVNGERALKIANGDDKPDLILLDIMMPGMSGYDVCKELKAHPATRDIPVIFVTAMSETVDEQLGLGLGAADYITKPISAPIVLARIKTQLSMKRVHDFLRDQNHFLETEVRDPHARNRRAAGRHHPHHGLAGRDARQRDRQPYPPHRASTSRRWPKSCATIRASATF